MGKNSKQQHMTTNELAGKIGELADQMKQGFEKTDTRMNRFEDCLQQVAEQTQKGFAQVDERFEKLQMMTSNEFVRLRDDMNERFTQVEDRFVQIRQDVLNLHDLHADHERRISTLETQ